MSRFLQCKECHGICLVLFGKAGGADDAGHAVFGAVFRRADRTGGGGKVNHHAPHRQVVQAGVDRDVPDLAGLLVDARHHAAVLALGDFFDQGMAHAAADTLQNDIGHGQSPFFCLSFIF